MATKTTKTAKKAKKRASKKKASKKKPVPKPSLAEKAAKQAEIAEAKRQATTIPVTNVTIDENSGDGHAIDHGTIMDNHIEPDTIKEGIETITDRDNSDLSFWGGSWTWVESANSYGDKPEDKWFINPSPKLIGEVMRDAPNIHEACRVALEVGNYQELLKKERNRFVEFLRDADQNELISESLDMLTAYQGRYFEAVQRYIGLCNSYENQLHNERATEDQIEKAELRKHDAGAQCRGWVARLMALVEAYHTVMTDERAYNLTYNFTPNPDSSQFGLYKWSVTNALNKIGRRLARSIKTGKMDAEQYRIPRPWLTESRLNTQVSANSLISDFNN